MPSKLDQRRLNDGAAAMSLAPAATLTGKKEQLAQLHDAITAMQSLDDLGSKEANEQAWRRMLELQRRYEKLRAEIAAQDWRPEHRMRMVCHTPARGWSLTKQGDEGTLERKADAGGAELWTVWPDHDHCSHGYRTATELALSWMPVASRHQALEHARRMAGRVADLQRDLDSLRSIARLKRKKGWEPADGDRIRSEVAPDCTGTLRLERRGEVVDFWRTEGAGGGSCATLNTHDVLKAYDPVRSAGAAEGQLANMLAELVHCGRKLLKVPEKGDPPDALPYSVFRAVLAEAQRLLDRRAKPETCDGTEGGSRPPPPAAPSAAVTLPEQPWCEVCGVRDGHRADCPLGGRSSRMGEVSFEFSRLFAKDVEVLSDAQKKRVAEGLEPDPAVGADGVPDRPGGGGGLPRSGPVAAAGSGELVALVRLLRAAGRSSDGNVRAAVEQLVAGDGGAAASSVLAGGSDEPELVREHEAELWWLPEPLSLKQGRLLAHVERWSDGQVIASWPGAPGVEGKAETESGALSALAEAIAESAAMLVKQRRAGVEFAGPVLEEWRALQGAVDLSGLLGPGELLGKDEA